MLLEFLKVFRVICLLGMLGWAAWTDLRTSRIPNELTYSGIAVGLLLGMIAGGWEGLQVALLGLLAGGGPFLAIYLLGVGWKKPLMGAGDVKLMAAIGALAGPQTAFVCITAGLTVAGIAALLLILWCTVKRKPLPKTIPLGACLSVGAALAMAINWGLL